MAIHYPDILAQRTTPRAFRYGDKDVMLYALGIGLGADPLDEKELAFVTEKQLKVVPTAATVLASRGQPTPGRAEPQPPAGHRPSQMNYLMMLHGEQKVELHKPLPASGTFTTEMRTVGAFDKGKDKGAVVVNEVDWTDESGEKVATLTMSAFYRGDGGFGGPSEGQPAPHAVPTRAPDVSVDLLIRPDQALLYRLNGDRNPLHSDPESARKSGFPRPILHGLCTYGMTCRAILASVLGYDAAAILSHQVRFTSPTFPGETLSVDIWKDGKDISFEARVKARDVTVVRNGADAVAVASSPCAFHPTARFDNHPADNKHIEVVPLAAAMGAEIRGARAAELSEAAFAEVRAALFRHKMIYFQGQGDGAGRAGRPSVCAFWGLRRGRLWRGRARPPQCPGGGQGGGPADRHDLRRRLAYRLGLPGAAMPAISLLYGNGAKVPPYGGDTIWANAALAYDCLSDTMRSMIAPLKVRMSMARVVANAQAHQAPDATPLGRVAATRGLARLPDEIVRKVKGSYHPLVRTHPVTGEKALYCDETYAAGIEGLTPAEAEPLLAFLVEHITQPAFTCRLRWAAGTLAVWDNRLCLHQAFNDYDTFERVFYRTTIAGETPA